MGACGFMQYGFTIRDSDASVHGGSSRGHGSDNPQINDPIDNENRDAHMNTSTNQYGWGGDSGGMEEEEDGEDEGEGLGVIVGKLLDLAGNE